MMRIIRFFLFLLFSCNFSFVFGQKQLNEIKDSALLEKIRFAKEKTDSFLLRDFREKERSKFTFEFSKSMYVEGELGHLYSFLNKEKLFADSINSIVHYYSFFDKEISLYTSISIYFYQDKEVQLDFQTPLDSLRYAALNKIYKKGLLKKIKAKAAAVKFKQPYTVIRIDNGSKDYSIILMDKQLPHNFFIR